MKIKFLSDVVLNLDEEDKEIRCMGFAIVEPQFKKGATYDFKGPDELGLMEDVGSGSIHGDVLQRIIEMQYAVELD